MNGALAVRRPRRARSGLRRYEGRKTSEIREERPGWTLWTDGVPNGETAAALAVRVDAVLAELRTVEGAALVFAHGHLLRVLAVRWIGLEPEAGRLLALDPATISVLGYERETPVIRVWNASIAS
jgi:probable phosphoglycerate mutase